MSDEYYGLVSARKQDRQEKQDQSLDILPKAVRYLDILKDAKRELGVSNYESIPEAIRQLKRVAANEESCPFCVDHKCTCKGSDIFP